MWARISASVLSGIAALDGCHDCGVLTGRVLRRIVTGSVISIGVIADQQFASFRRRRELVRARMAASSSPAAQPAE